MNKFFGSTVSLLQILFYLEFNISHTFRSRRTLLTFPSDDNGTVLPFSTKHNGTSIEKIVAEQLHLCPFNPLCYNGNGYHLSCCSPCSCQLDCQVTGSCCPDRLTDVRLPEVIIKRSKFQCNRPQLKKEELSDINEHAVLMISICSSYHQSEYLISRCDHSEDVDAMFDVSVVIPVESATTGELFKNRYCAECNNITVDGTVAWLPWVKCIDGVTLPPFSIENFLNFIQETRECNIVYESDENSKSHAELCGYGSVTICNQTGLWENYDPLIDAACHMYTSWYDKIYRNVFCFICNTNKNEQIQTTCNRDDETESWTFGGFSALLNFNMETFDDVQISSKCNRGFIWDHHQETCRKVYCSSPNVYMEGNCTSLYRKSNEFAFELYIKIQPGNIRLDVRTPDISQVHSTILFWLTDIGIISNYICKFTILETKHGFSLDNVMDDVPGIERDITDTLSLLVYLKIQLPDDLVIARLTNAIGHYNYSNLTFMAGTDHWTASLDGGYYKGEILQSMQVALIDVNLMLSKPKCDNPFRITALINCPQIHLRTSEFYIRNDSSLCLNETDRCLSKDKFIKIDESETVAVCITDYFFSRLSDEHLSNVDMTEWWISFACTSLSVVCLSFTLLTYCLFHELRTLPGKNNMALVVSMIIAQLLFQFGLNASNNGPACISIGVGIHFFWLLTMFSMNVCTIHMFRTFVRLTSMPLSIASQTRSFFLYCIYSISMSSLFVLINIIVSLSESKQQNVGYGGAVCYITTRIMTGITFALPVGLVVGSNTIMFFIVVYRIHRLPTMNKNSTLERNNFKIYIKLSSLTGGTWISGFVYQWTRSIVFQYIFIVATCCQGLFIMLSFVCNTRVKKLYMYRCAMGYADRDYTGSGAYSDCTLECTSNSKYLTNETSTSESPHIGSSTPRQLSSKM